MNNNTLDGVKMLHHDEMRNYDRIQGKIISVIMNHGCKIIETPSFEDYDVYQHFFPQLRQQMASGQRRTTSNRRPMQLSTSERSIRKRHASIRKLVSG